MIIIIKFDKINLIAIVFKVKNSFIHLDEIIITVAPLFQIYGRLLLIYIIFHEAIKAELSIHSSFHFWFVDELTHMASVSR